MEGLCYIDPLAYEISREFCRVLHFDTNTCHLKMPIFALNFLRRYFKKTLTPSQVVSNFTLFVIRDFIPIAIMEV